MADEPIIVERVDAAEDLWQPVVGAGTVEFLDTVVPGESRDSLRTSSVSILGKGVSPSQGAGQQTGLVVGYVQSGKTMSFELIAALARDNGVQMVIVVAGRSNNLLDQSTRRFVRDLRIDEPDLVRRWVQLQNPGRYEATTAQIRNILEDWRDPETPEDFKKTILVTVLKHHQRIANLAQLLGDVGMEDTPVLVIDDEADQASLNTEVAQNEESATYRRLMELRRALPLHTFIQYTATPQAPLLVSIIDTLSPNFVQVLEPGRMYVGGQDLFTGNMTHVRVIPPGEVPTNNNPLNEPPDSLLFALRVFMVGVCAGLVLHGNAGNRSMVVHPSHLTAQHSEFYAWVQEIFYEWQRILGLPDDDPDKQELLEDFRVAHEDIAQTAEDLPEFPTLMARMRFAFRNTQVLEVNAATGKTPQVDWRSMYGWVLVGGMALDRGFTVEGLTVTYMPRGIGVGNADTVQQRARFFGYKRSYLGYCRVYLEDGTLDAYQSYVDHEEDMRNQLLDIQAGNLALNEWKRAFVLDVNLKPCRDAVIEFDYAQGCHSDTWVSPRVVFASDEVVVDNRRAVQEFVAGLELEDDEGHEDRTLIQRHQICEEVPLQAVLENLLLRYRVTAVRDSQLQTGMLLQLGHAIEIDNEETCTVYVMSHGENRQRAVDETGKISELYQGQYPVERARRGEIYPGDRALRAHDQVTVQIHRLELRQGDQTVAEDVYVIAVWVPARMAIGWVDQHQPHQDQ